MRRHWTPCIYLVGMQNDTAAVTSSLVVPQKVKYRLTIDSVPLLGIPLLSIYTKELKTGMLVCACSLQHYSQKPKSENNPSIHQQMDKQIVAYPFNGILFSCKKE